jgi:pyruvate dehydrogenase E2 component (dihydrolipoamide acetyltransferase)
MRDGLTVCHVPAFSLSIEADMTDARNLLAIAKSRGMRLTYTHVMVRAAALALSQNDDLNQMTGGNRVYQPEHIDIGLSIAGDTSVAPVMVIENSGAKALPEIAREIVERAPAVREADRVMRKALDRWGFIIPFGFIRRALLRALFRSVHFRRKGSGTFQVSIMKGADHVSTPVFSSSAALIVGSVRDKPVAIEGKGATILPMVTLICCADHRIWDGRAAYRFLDSVRNILESGRLTAEMMMPSESFIVPTTIAGTP